PGWLLRGAEDAGVGGVRGADVGGVLRPRSRVAAGPWWWWCRWPWARCRSGVGDFGDGCAGGLLVDDGLAGGVGGGPGLDGEVVDRAGVAAGGGVDQGGRVIAEQGVRPARELEVVADVAAGFGAGHRRHRVSQRGALLQGGEHGELHGAPQGGLADE